MGNKLCPKIILEDTRLAFKTEIAFELNEHPRIVGPRKYRYHSPLISTEWCTFTNYPWGRGRSTLKRRRKKRLRWKPMRPGPGCSSCKNIIHGSWTVFIFRPRPIKNKPMAKNMISAGWRKDSCH